MPNLFRRTFLFAAGALVTTAAVVRVQSSAVPKPLPADAEIYMAVLAEGTQWEVVVSGGGLSGTWHIDVPPSCQALAPADRMAAVDKIMRLVAEGARKQQASAIPAISGRRQLALASRIA
jgi:hypothetical protein